MCVDTYVHVHSTDMHTHSAVRAHIYVRARACTHIAYLLHTRNTYADRHRRKIKSSSYPVFIKYLDLIGRRLDLILFRTPQILTHTHSQVGVRHQYQGSQARIALFIKNKSLSTMISGLALTMPEVRHARAHTRACTHTLFIKNKSLSTIVSGLALTISEVKHKHTHTHTHIPPHTYD